MPFTCAKRPTDAFCPYLADVEHGCGWAAQPAAIPSASSELKILWIVRTSPPFCEFSRGEQRAGFIAKESTRRWGRRRRFREINQESNRDIESKIHLIFHTPLKAGSEGTKGPFNRMTFVLTIWKCAIHSARNACVGPCSRAFGCCSYFG